MKNRNFSEEEVYEIRVAYLHSDLKLREIAATYGVSTTTIGNLVRGGSWKDVPMPRAIEREKEKEDVNEETDEDEAEAVEDDPPACGRNGTKIPVVAE